MQPSWDNCFHINKTWKLILVIISLIICYGFFSHLKITKIMNNPETKENDDRAIFWSESAFHYRYVKLLIEDQSLFCDSMSADKKVQAPYTVPVAEHCTVALEFPIALTYNLFGNGMPLHHFIVYFVSFWSSISVFFIFLCSYQLWKNYLAGIFSVLLFITLHINFSRTVIGILLREDFAIPFIVTHVFFLILYLKNYKTRDAILSSIFMGFALASWHVTPFIFTVEVFSFIVLYFFDKQFIFKRLKDWVWFLGILLLFSLIVPVIRAKAFYLSLAMILLYSQFILFLISGKRLLKLWQEIIVILSSLTIFVFIAGLFKTSYSEYSHVYLLFLYKLINFGKKPDNPLDIPYDANVLWQGAFNSTPPSFLWMLLSMTLILAFIICVFVFYKYRFKKAFENSHSIYWLSIFILIFIVLTFFVTRNATILGYTLPILASGVMVIPFYEHKLTKYFTLGILILSFMIQAIEINYDTIDSGNRPKAKSYRPIIEWINNNTRKNDVILSEIDSSPIYLAHTGRPIVIHSKFENSLVRESYKEYIFALFNTEESFYKYCIDHKVDYYIYELNTFTSISNESKRFLVNKVKPLPIDNPVSMFQFTPERLEHFDLLFQSTNFRVYKVLKSGEKKLNKEIRYDIIYDPQSTKIVDGGYDTNELRDKITMLTTNYNYSLGKFNNNEISEAVNYLNASLSIAPKHVDSIILLAKCYHKAGKIDEAFNLYKRAIEIDKQSENANEGYLELIIMTGKLQTDEGIALINNAFNYYPKSVLVNYGLGLLSYWSSKFTDSERYFLYVISKDNKSFYGCYKALGSIYDMKNDFKKAYEYYKLYTETAPPAESDIPQVKQRMEQIKSTGK